MASIRERVMAGDQVLGAMIFEFFSPGIPQLMVQAGCEYLIYDMEHTGTGFETLKAQVAHCNGLPITPMVRVPRGEYHFLARALDIGMQGLMIPMVESAEEAEAIAQASRYPPMGRRGAAFGFAHDGYTGGDPAGKIALANHQNVVIAQIETERGLENVDAIAATHRTSIPGVAANAGWKTSTRSPPPRGSTSCGSDILIWPTSWAFPVNSRTRFSWTRFRPWSTPRGAMAKAWASCPPTQTGQPNTKAMASTCWPSALTTGC